MKRTKERGRRGRSKERRKRERRREKQGGGGRRREEVRWKVKGRGKEGGQRIVATLNSVHSAISSFCVTVCVSSLNVLKESSLFESIRTSANGRGSPVTSIVFDSFCLKERMRGRKGSG